MANFPKFETIEYFDEALENALEFQKINSTCGGAFESLGRYYHWYYFPKQQIFAPSKFIGYKNMTFAIYDEYYSVWLDEIKVLDGRNTQEILYASEMFCKLRHDSKEFERLVNKLETFVGEFKKSVSARTYTRGGIYIPNVGSPC